MTSLPLFYGSFYGLINWGALLLLRGTAKSHCLIPQRPIFRGSQTEQIPLAQRQNFIFLITGQCIRTESPNSFSHSCSVCKTPSNKNEWSSDAREWIQKTLPNGWPTHNTFLEGSFTRPQAVCKRVCPGVHTGKHKSPIHTPVGFLQKNTGWTLVQPQQTWPSAKTWNGAWSMSIGLLWHVPPMSAC